MSIPKLPGKPQPTFTGFNGIVKSVNYAPTDIDKFYAELEAWHAKVFEGAVEVEAALRPEGDWYAYQKGCRVKTHKALLINIQPIKEETAEDILIQWVQELESANGLTIDHLTKAKAYLERKK